MASYIGIQSYNFYSSGNAPSSIGGSVASTEAGNLLVYFVTATSSGTPTIASPGGSWTSLYNTSIAGLAYACFYQLSNVGGITTVSCNLSTTTAGGAVGQYVEFTVSPSYGFSNNFGLGNHTSYNQSSATVPWNVPALANFRELLAYCVHFKAATYTSNNSYEWGTGDTVVSTGATNNAQLITYYGVCSEEINPPVGGGSLSVSESCGLGYACFTSSIDYALNGGIEPNNGTSGYKSPIFFQGMVGG